MRRREDNNVGSWIFVLLFIGYLLVVNFLLKDAVKEKDAKIRYEMTHWFDNVKR